MPSKKKRKNINSSSSSSKKKSKRDPAKIAKKKKEKRDATIAKIAKIKTFANRTLANAAFVAIAAFAKPDTFDDLRELLNGVVVHRENPGTDGRHFREWKIDVQHFLANPQNFGLKILEELAELGGNSGTNTNRVNNRVFRCKTCGHTDYEDDGIVYAIIIQENEGTPKNPKYVDRITWVDEYGWPILKEIDRRIIAVKRKKWKTAYASVNIPDECPHTKKKTRNVHVHALLFNNNEDYGRGPFDETDHITHTNGLNNLLANVRDGAPDGTRHQNMNNQSMREDNTSGHRGVCDEKGENRWRVKYNVWNSETKTSSEKKKNFPYTKDDAVDKQEKKNAAVEFRKKVHDDKYLNDLAEHYKSSHARNSHWFAMRVLEEFVKDESKSEWKAWSESVSLSLSLLKKIFEASKE